MNDAEILYLKLLKLKYRREGPNNSAVLQSWFLPRNQAPSIQVIQLFYKIGFPPHPWKLGTLFNLRKFQKTGEN